MKKLLFVLAPLCHIISSCNAEATIEETPKFTISGAATISSNFSSPDVSYYNGQNQAPQTKNIKLKSTEKANKDTSMTRFCAGSANVLFSALGKLKNGWTYGAKLDLYAMRGETKIDKMYGIFERHNVGTFFFGSVKGPEDTYLCGGQQLIGGGAGVDGIVTSDLNYATGIVSPVYMIGCTGKSTKVVYYTPKLHGFQVGIAITPDTKHQGRSAKNWHTGNSDNGNDAGLFTKNPKDREQASGRNNIVIGLTHFHEFNKDWSTQVAGVYLMEDTQPVRVNYYEGEIKADSSGVVKPAGDRVIKLHNASAYQFTGTVTYKGWSFGAGYLDNGKSRLPVASEYLNSKTGAIITPGGFLSTKDGNSGKAWNVGLRYAYEKWEFAGAYNNSIRKVTSTEKSKADLYTFTVDYKICSGLKVFGEIDYISTKASDYACSIYNLIHDSKKAIKSQNGVLIAVGAKVSF